MWDDPPPVTPIGWDLPPTSTNNTSKDAPAESTTQESVDSTVGTTNPACADTGGQMSGQGGPWPRVVDGIRIPAPGAGIDLEGLDTIDPNSTDPAVKDRRTHAQRLLDGLIACTKLAARTGKLPTNGGLKTQLIITTTQKDLNRHRKTRNGTAHTPYSGPVPLAPFEEACCDADLTRLFLGTGQTILDVGRTQRLFTPAQRKILIARDLGCTIPDCTAPAYWCQAHHITPWLDGGKTSINNAALLCEHHHHLIHRTDWTITLIHGTPHFTPPYPIGTQRHNTYHHRLPAN